MNLRDYLQSFLYSIKIYPEWNVNNYSVGGHTKHWGIKIYPEWNVNLSIFKTENFDFGIKIYPEWNVNEEMDLDNPKLAD